MRSPIRREIVAPQILCTKDLLTLRRKVGASEQEREVFHYGMDGWGHRLNHRAVDYQGG
jgi:hypothetical protein